MDWCGRREDEELRLVLESRLQLAEAGTPTANCTTTAFASRLLSLGEWRILRAHGEPKIRIENRLVGSVRTFEV
jgi:hypothetical protein